MSVYSTRRRLGCLRVMLCCLALPLMAPEGFAQLKGPFPPGWKTSAVYHIDVPPWSFKPAPNRLDSFPAELQDTNLVRTIGRAAGLKDADLALVPLAVDPDGHWVRVDQIGEAEAARKAMAGRVKDYIDGRQQGHTPEFILASFTNHTVLAGITDPGLRLLLSKHPQLPAASLVLCDPVKINQAGKEGWRITYALIDGELAWDYPLDGPAGENYQTRHDAKEHDPKYRHIFKEIEAEVEAELKAAGTPKQHGYFLKYSQLKKEKLKARGIDWRSPVELNPNTVFD